MQVLINTDHSVRGNAALTVEIRGLLESALRRFDDHLTRVEVHLSDVNGPNKGGPDDMRCMMEARLAGCQPIAVTHQAATLQESVDGATDKLTRLIDNTIEKRRDQRSRMPNSLADTKPGDGQ